MDKLKAQINVAGSVNSATADIQTVEANLPGALRLAAEILREPSFPQAEFEQVRQQSIASIEEGRSEPQVLAFQALQRRINSIYPRGDVRYVGTVDEDIEDLKKVTLDEAKKFYQQFYGVSEGEFTVVGQFDQAGIQKLGEELFGNWKGAASYARILSPYRKIEPANVKIETPDKQNALSVAGQMGRAH